MTAGIPALDDRAIGDRKAYVVIEVTERRLAENTLHGVRLTVTDYVTALGAGELKLLGLWDEAKAWDEARA